jgi:hypothetical protein
MVLWYWAAVDLVETIREKNNGKILIPPHKLTQFEKTWKKAIAYFVATVYKDRFMVGFFESKEYIDIELSANFISEIREKLILQIENKLQNFHDACLPKEVNSKKLFQNLLSCINEEIRIAKIIKALHFRIETKNNGQLLMPAVGRAFLDELSWTQKIINELKNLSSKNNSETKELLIAFSRYSYIQHLLNKKQFDTVLWEISKLKKNEKLSHEVIQLKRTAISAKLELAVSNKDINSLFSIRQKFFNNRNQETIHILEPFVEKIYFLATELQSNNSEKSFLLLYWLNLYFPDHQNTKLKLASIYFVDGIQIFNEGFSAYRKDKGEKSKWKMVNGQDKLKKATEIDPTNAKYKEELKKVTGFLDSIQPEKIQASKKNEKGVNLLKRINEGREKNIEKIKTNIILAKKFFNEARNLNPQNETYSENQKIAEKYLKDITEQIEKNRPFELNAKGVKLIKESRDEVKNGNFDVAERKLNESLRYFDEALNIVPEDENINKNKAIAQNDLKELDLFEETFKANNNNAEGVRLINASREDINNRRFQEAKNKLKKAVNLLEQANRLAPTDENIKKNLEIAHSDIKQVALFEEKIENQEQANNNNAEGVSILNRYQEDYQKYMQVYYRIKSIFEQINDKYGTSSAQLDYQKIMAIVKTEYRPILSIYEDLREQVNLAFEKINSALRAFPENATFEKNWDISTEMLANLKMHESFIYDELGKNIPWEISIPDKPEKQKHIPEKIIAAKSKKKRFFERILNFK